MTAGLIFIWGRGRGSRAELDSCLLQVVFVEVEVAESVDEFAGLQAADLRDHAGEQRVRGDVERHAEEQVGAALVKLAAQFAVEDEKLKQRMAGRQRHLPDLAGIPGGDDVAAAVGLASIWAMTSCDLVDENAVGRAPVAPLRAIDAAEIAGSLVAHSFQMETPCS